MRVLVYCVDENSNKSRCHESHILRNARKVFYLVSIITKIPQSCWIRFTRACPRTFVVFSFIQDLRDHLFVGIYVVSKIIMRLSILAILGAPVVLAQGSWASVFCAHSSLSCYLLPDMLVRRWYWHKVRGRLYFVLILLYRVLYTSWYALLLAYSKTLKRLRCHSKRYATLY